MDTVQIRKIFQDMKTGGVEGRGAVFLFRDKKLSFSHNVGVQWHSRVRAEIQIFC